MREKRPKPEKNIKERSFLLSERKLIKFVPIGLSGA